MKLAAAMEMVVIASVGMAAASWVLHDPRMSGIYASAKWSLRFRDTADGFAAGVALAGCAAVWIERARRRSPRPWGPGRWAWSVVGIYIPLHHGATFLRRTVAAYRTNEALMDIIGGFPDNARASLLFWLRNASPYMLIAVGATYLAATPRPTPRADGREWAGRALAAWIVVSGILNLMLIGTPY